MATFSRTLPELFNIIASLSEPWYHFITLPKSKAQVWFNSEQNGSSLREGSMTEPLLSHLILLCMQHWYPGYFVRRLEGRRTTSQMLRTRGQTEVRTSATITTWCAVLYARRWIGVSEVNINIHCCTDSSHLSFLYFHAQSSAVSGAQPWDSNKLAIIWSALNFVDAWESATARDSGTIF